MTPPDADGAVQYALARLETESAPERTYHSVAHTRDEVMPAAVQLGRLCDLDEESLTTLRIAAAFHDLGYVERPEDHEVASARTAAQVLPAFGFGNRQIEDVMALILATRLPHHPRNLMEKIMADADMDGLGREEFMHRNLDLLEELRALGTPIPLDDWYRAQIQFLESYHYFTPEARALRENEKARNVERVQALLEQVSP